MAASSMTLISSPSQIGAEVHLDAVLENRAELHSVVKIRSSFGHPKYIFSDIHFLDEAIYPHFIELVQEDSCLLFLQEDLNTLHVFPTQVNHPHLTYLASLRNQIRLDPAKIFRIWCQG